MKTAARQVVRAESAAADNESPSAGRGVPGTIGRSGPAPYSTLSVLIELENGLIDTPSLADYFHLKKDHFSL